MKYEKVLEMDVYTIIAKLHYDKEINYYEHKLHKALEDDAKRKAKRK